MACFKMKKSHKCTEGLIKHFSTAFKSSKSGISGRFENLPIITFLISSDDMALLNLLQLRLTFQLDKTPSHFVLENHLALDHL